MKKLLCSVCLFYILSANIQAQPAGVHRIDDNSKAEQMINHYRSIFIKKPKTVVYDEFTTTALQELIAGSSSVKFILAAYPKDDEPEKRNFPIILVQVNSAKAKATGTTTYYYATVCPPPDGCPFPITLRANTNIHKKKSVK